MKTGLFVPAPVSLSPYVTGAVQALMNEGGLTFDVIASCSGAALPAGYAAMNAIDELAAIWERLENKDWAEVNWGASIKGALFWSPSLMDNRPVHRTAIDGHILENRLRPGVRWRFHAVRLTSGQEEIWEYPGESLSLEKAVHLAMAVPVLFPAIDYDGAQWVDAATLNGSPLEELILNTDVERVFFVGHAPQSALTDIAGNAVKILMTALEWNQFSEELISLEHANEVNDLARAWRTDRAAVEQSIGELIEDTALRSELLLEIDRLYREAAFPIARGPIEIIPVLPQQRLDGLFGDFQPARSRRLLELGRQAARRVLKQLDLQGNHV
jgi:predicted acylesterase/phospholipase RssA